MRESSAGESPPWVAIDSAFGCGTHGTIGGPPATLRADVFGDQDGDGLINGRIGIVDTFIAPTSSTNCVAAIGLGNLGITAPSGIQVTSAEIAVVNQRTGLATPLREFSFFSSSTTTAGMATGGNGILPLFSGSAWYGLYLHVTDFMLGS